MKQRWGKREERGEVEEGEERRLFMLCELFLFHPKVLECLQTTKLLF